MHKRIWVKNDSSLDGNILIGSKVFYILCSSLHPLNYLNKIVFKKMIIRNATVSKII